MTDGTDTVQSTITVTVIGAPTKEGEYGVNKVFVPPDGGPSANSRAPSTRRCVIG